MVGDKKIGDIDGNRRKFILTAGSVGITTIAGCIGGQQNQNQDTTENQQTENQQNMNGGSVGTLSAGGSSTVYPITSTAASYWNSNPPASDKEYWGPKQYDINTNKNLADYWGGLYGFESGKGSNPPFPVTVGLSHSGVGVEKVRKGIIDIGDSSAPVSAELPDASEEELKKFTDHVVGVDAQPIVVSRAIYDAGVKKITIDELRGIYKGNITNWSQIDSYNGPDKEIQAIGRAEGSGTDTAFRLNVFGNPDASIPGIDVRKGQNQQVKTLVSNTENAIAYMALAFVEPGGAVPPIALEIEGTTYEYGKNLADKEYPLNRDLHCYTWKGTSKKEAAFLRLIISDFGQEHFVSANNYVKLTPERIENQLSKLPETQV